MEYEVEVGGRSRHVSVSRTGATFAVTVDGRTWQVDVAPIDAHTLSLVLDKVWSKDAVIVPDPATGQLTVRIDGVPVAVTLSRLRAGPREGAERARRSGNVASQGSAGSHDRPVRLTAPMPGKVVRVLVSAGEAVKRRQGLLVVEAMKMENELRAGRDGIVAEVHATEGQSVDAGALLIVIQ